MFQITKNDDTEIEGTLPYWIPNWVIRILSKFGVEFFPAIQCYTCGALIRIDAGMSEKEIDERAECHYLFFHSNLESTSDSIT